MFVNWFGGLLHAKESRASGFYYVSDVVLVIVELLKYHQRILCIDIDIHRSYGVDWRVMTVSFHNMQSIVQELGADGTLGLAKYYAVNYPLEDGLDDEFSEAIFKWLMSKVMMFQPTVVFLQCS